MRLNCTVTISSVLFLSSFQNGSIKKDPMQRTRSNSLVEYIRSKIIFKKVISSYSGQQLWLNEWRLDNCPFLNDLPHCLILNGTDPRHLTLDSRLSPLHSEVGKRAPEAEKWPPLALKSIQVTPTCVVQDHPIYPPHHMVCVQGRYV